MDRPWGAVTDRCTVTVTITRSVVPGVMRNVVLCCLDSVRADVFAAVADRLRDRAELRYDGCRAASSWSAPSYASMLTGRLPHDHGVTTHDPSLASVEPSETFLADLDGYGLTGVSTNVFAGSAFGFDRFFDRFVDVTEATRFPEGLDPAAFRSDRDGLRAYPAYLRAALAHDRPAASLANGAIGLLDTLSEDAPVPKPFDDGATAVIREGRRAVERTGEPFFLFTTFMEAHTPLRHVRGFDRALHDAPRGFTTDERSVWELMDATDEHAEFLRHRRGLYAAAVDYLDRTLVPFVDRLVAETDRETTVVITADHGENQGYPWEEGRVRHKSSLSEGLLHVPLLVVNPPAGYPAVESGYVSQLELGRLLVAFARGETIDPTADRIVAEHAGMSAGPEPPDSRAYWDRLMRAAYDDDRKVVWDSLGGVAAYELDRSRPCWQRRLDGEATVPEWARDRFRGDAVGTKRRLVESSRRRDVDAPVRERLEKLGYV